jgi:hypothetical protein
MNEQIQQSDNHSLPATGVPTLTPTILSSFEDFDATVKAVSAADELKAKLTHVLKRGRSAGIEAGQILNHLKDRKLIPHGEWEPFLKGEAAKYGLSIRSLQEYMKMAKNAGPAFLPKPKPTPKARKQEKQYPVSIKLLLPGDKADKLAAMKGTPALEAFIAELTEAALRIL